MKKILKTLLLTVFHILIIFFSVINNIAQLAFFYDWTHELDFLTFLFLLCALVVSYLLLHWATNKNCVPLWLPTVWAIGDTAIALGSIVILILLKAFVWMYVDIILFHFGMLSLGWIFLFTRKKQTKKLN